MGLDREAWAWRTREEKRAALRIGSLIQFLDASKTASNRQRKNIKKVINTHIQQLVK